ncbi:hypothetical protein C8R47DRAFT_1327256 [Mycena vitilis]|nr:hypothetical protein C8R47DRAFT_1327256 [Mycena vitilis]
MTQALLLPGDFIVFALTVRRGYIQRRACLGYTGTLIERMVTDGAMYFVLMVLTNLANVLTYYFGDALIAGLLSWFAISVAMTVLSRLMLNLHEVATTTTAGPSTMELETLRFFSPTVATISEV